MGKNKDRLNQKSIPWADSILDQVMNLPAAGGEDLQGTVEAQTEAVNTLLKMASRKVADHRGEGEYVWKKSLPMIRLPEGYTEIEYIETTGTQYIDTGFYPNQDTRVVVDVDTTSSKSLSFPAIFSTSSLSSNKQRFVLMLYNEQAGFHDHYGGTAINSSNIGMYGRHIIDKNKNITYLDGEAVSTFAYSAFQSTVSLNLFASNDGSMQYYAKVKMYSCKVYDNDVLIRDFVPCKNASGTVGLYDIVNSKFYANNGTGTFTAGEEYTYREFEGYIVGLNADDYPENGMSGEYYYELMGQETEDEEGVIGIEYGTITLPTNQSSLTISHSLGVAPSIAMLIPNGKVNTTGAYLIVHSSNVIIQPDSQYNSTFAYCYMAYSSGGTYSSRNSLNELGTRTDTNITFNSNSTANNLIAYGSYRWVAIA